MMQMADLNFVNLSAFRSDNSKTGGLLVDGSSSNTGFQQLLTQLIGQGNMQQIIAQGNQPALALLANHLAWTDSEDGAELDMLQQWLEQMLAALEKAGPEITQWLEQHPESMQWLTAIVDMLPNNHQANNGGSQPADLQARLAAALQQLHTQLTQGQPSHESLTQVKTLQQLLQPVLDASDLQMNDRNGNHANLTHMLSTAGKDLQSGQQVSLMQSGLNNQQSNGGTEQQAHQAPQQDRNMFGSISSAGSASTLLPRADLLRPELLHLAMGDMSETTTSEIKLSETPSAPQALSGDLIKPAGEFMLQRPSAPQMPQVPVDQFIEEMNRIVLKSFQMTQLNGVAEAKISLVPEHLGQVDIKLTMQNGHLVAQLIAETSLGREALEQQLGALRSALQGQGIQVDRLEVTQPTSSSTPFFKEQGHQQSSQQQKQQSRANEASYEEDVVLFHDELEIAGSEYDTYVSGRSFHATA